MQLSLLFGPPPSPLYWALICVKRPYCEFLPSGRKLVIYRSACAARFVLVGEP